MELWLLLAVAFLIQEPISSGALLLTAYQLHYNVWLIHLLFAAATLLDILIGYYIGIWINKKFGERKMVVWLKTRLDKFSAFVGKNGKIAALIVYAPIIFPFSGIFIPWLDISLTEALIYMFIGEIIFWYAPEWLLVLGVKNFVTDPITAILVITLVSILLIVLPAYFSKRKAKTPTAS